MFNTSVLENNISLDSSCDNGTDIGMVVFYIVVPVSVLLGTPAYLWFIWISLRDGWKIKPTQVFVLNVTILELIFSIRNVLGMINLLFINSETLNNVIIAVVSLTWVGIPLMQVCICVEQYLAVVYPITFLKYKALQYRIMCAAVVWMVAATPVVYQVLLNNYLMSFLCAVFFMSVIIISFCCVSVLRALKHPGPGDTQITVERGRDVGNQQKRNAFNTIFSGLIMILFAYLTLITEIMFSVSFCHFNNILSSLNIFGVLIMAFRRMYKNGTIKCLTHSRETS